MRRDLWPLAGTGASDTCVARGSRGESGGGVGLTSLPASLWSVRPQLRSRVWPLSQGGYWELLTLATGHLILLTLGLSELCLVQDPVAAAHPSAPPAQFKTRSGLNKRGQGSSAGRFMSLWSSNSLLAHRLNWKLWIVRCWWMMNLSRPVMLFLPFATVLELLHPRSWTVKCVGNDLASLCIRCTLSYHFLQFSLMTLERVTCSRLELTLPKG